MKKSILKPSRLEITLKNVEFIGPVIDPKDIVFENIIESTQEDGTKIPVNLVIFSANSK